MQSLRIYNELPVAQELIGQTGGDIQVTSCITCKIKYNVLHTFLFQIISSFTEFIRRCKGKPAQFDISYISINNIGGVDAVDWYFISGNGKIQQLFHVSAMNAYGNFCTFFSAQHAENIIIGKSYAGNIFAVNLYNTISGPDPYFFRGAAQNRTYDE